MKDYVDGAMRIDVSSAALAVHNVAVDETRRQVDQLMGGRPVPGSPEWAAISGTTAGTQRELATQLLQLRIELTVGLDPLGTVVGLRRWGATWEQISHAAGASRQTAYERWGERVRDVLDRYRTGDLGGPGCWGRARSSV